MSDMNMTPAEQSLADDKMRAEIAKLLAETKCRVALNYEMRNPTKSTAALCP